MGNMEHNIVTVPAIIFIIKAAHEPNGQSIDILQGATQLDPSYIIGIDGLSGKHISRTK